MTIRLTESQSKPMLGGARIASSGPRPFSRPESSETPLIEDENNLEELEAASACPIPTQGINCSKSGLTGLSNLGNTCFMNCIIQSLANIRELRDYFLTKQYLNDVNINNPLGTSGNLAKAFHTTLTHLWSGTCSSYSAYELKATISKKTPQFMGFMQHDAQEFLAFFLDLLHEDVNRIIEKPLFEMPDLSSCPDQVIAEETWKLYKSRNDSFIVDMFHGMMKSKLTCPKCQRQSTTFDPYVFLPVPIPRGQMKLRIFFYGDEGPSVFRMFVPEDCKASWILTEASSRFSIPRSSLRLFKITSSNVLEELHTKSSISYCQFSTLVVMEGIGDQELQNIVILQRQKTQDVCQSCLKTPEQHKIKILRCSKCKLVGYCNQECQKADWPKHKTKCCQSYVGLPFIIQGREGKLNFQFIFSEIMRWLDFSVNISCDDEYIGDEDNTPDISLLHQNKAIGIYAFFNGNMKDIRCCNNEKSLNSKGLTHLIVEWGQSIILTPKIIESRGATMNADINDCLRLFTEPEVLAAEEAWHCPGCKQSRRATKELSLWKLPEVLIIQLKRFSLQNRMWRQKIDDMIEFPINGLDMRPFCVNDQEIDPIYDLFAVANHHGGLFGGHYTSYVTMSGDTEPGWRFCDDSEVTRIRSLDQLVTKSSYVMFYRRRAAGSACPPPHITPIVSKKRGKSASTRSKLSTKKGYSEDSPSTSTVVPSVLTDKKTAPDCVRKSPVEFLNKQVKNSKKGFLKEISSIKNCAGKPENGSKILTSNECSLSVSESNELPYTDMDAVD